MISPRTQAGQCLGGQRRQIRFEANAPQPLALAGPEPEPPLLQFPQDVVQPGRIFTLLQHCIVHGQEEIENRVAEHCLHLVIRVRFRSPTILVQLDAHAQVEKVVSRITILLQLTFHSSDEPFRHSGAVQPLP